MLLGRLEMAMDLTQFDVGKESDQNSGTNDGVDEALLAEVMQGEDTHAVDLSDEKIGQVCQRRKYFSTSR